MASMTKHAEKRAQQRCISDKNIAYLEKFGCKQYDSHGAIKIFFNKYSKRKMRYQGINLPQNLENMYIVKACDNGEIITTGYRTKRIKRG